MYLAEPSPLTAAQQAMHTGSAALLRELRDLRGLVRDLDGAREDAESEREVDASFSAEDLLEHFLCAIEQQMESAGIAVPAVRRAA